MALVRKLGAEGMDNAHDIQNDKWLREALGGLSRETHIPPEIILADARGDLTAEGHEIVASHVKDCGDCRAVVRLAEEAIRVESLPVPELSDSEVAMPKTLESKARLLARFNAKRDEIVEKVAQLLLPKEVWFSIKPTVAVVRNWSRTSQPKRVEYSNDLAAAAFSSEATSEQTKNFEVVINVVSLIDWIGDVLLERHNDLEKMRQELPSYVDQAVLAIDNVALDEHSKQETVRILSDGLLVNEEGC